MKKTLPIIYLGIACIAVAMQLLFRNFLFRRYGYDSIFVGCFPNFIAVVLLSLIFNLVKGEKKDGTPLKVSLMATAAMVFYEFVQPFIQERTFDWLDIAASFAGGLFIYFILLITPKTN
ncbi:hypothetical protein [Pedobacter aquatilis]|uniref:hypothetical protein n=1 Tax=Pedobacter aquatilis TaxID=351343 RepID=UPI00293055AB|nr:hypothetical protein [Pedobacter aquatilis]